MEEAVIQSTEQGQAKQSYLASADNIAVVRRRENPELIVREPRVFICFAVVPSRKEVGR
jgi:hypothetical protein